MRKRGRGRKRGRKSGGKGGEEEREGTERKQARKERSRVGNHQCVLKSVTVFTVVAIHYKGELVTSNWKNLLSTK